MSNLLRAVSLLAVLHPRLLSDTSSAMTHGRCHELLPMMVVTLVCMPQVYTSGVWEMVQCSEVLTFLSSQIFHTLHW
jgi:hypothetical protein